MQLKIQQNQELVNDKTKPSDTLLWQLLTKPLLWCFLFYLNHWNSKYYSFEDHRNYRQVVINIISLCHFSTEVSYFLRIYQTELILPNFPSISNWFFHVPDQYFSFFSPTNWSKLCFKRVHLHSSMQAKQWKKYQSYNFSSMHFTSCSKHCVYCPDIWENLQIRF